MKKPEIEVVRFGAEDVIATSAAPKLVKWSNLGEDAGDSSVSFGGKNYGQTKDEGYNTPGAAVTALKDYYGWSGSPSASNVRFSIDSDTTSYKTLANLWNDADAPAWAIIPPAYNGSYTFDQNISSGSNYYWFFKQ